MKLEPFEMPPTLKPYTYDTAKFGDVIANDEGDTWLIGRGSDGNRQQFHLSDHNQGREMYSSKPATTWVFKGYKVVGQWDYTNKKIEYFKDKPILFKDIPAGVVFTLVQYGAIEYVKLTVGQGSTGVTHLFEILPTQGPSWLGQEWLTTFDSYTVTSIKGKIVR